MYEGLLWVTASSIQRGQRFILGYKGRAALQSTCGL